MQQASLFSCQEKEEKNQFESVTDTARDASLYRLSERIANPISTDRELGTEITSRPIKLLSVLERARNRMRCPPAFVKMLPFVLRRDSLTSSYSAWVEMFFLRSQLEQSSSTSEQYSSAVSQGLLEAFDGSDTFRTQVARADYVAKCAVCPHPPQPKKNTTFPIDTYTSKNQSWGGEINLAKIL